jgi:nucleotide-binding universal stress UspA family protein
MTAQGVRYAAHEEDSVVQHLIVPVDGSSVSWRAFDVALGIAHRCGGDIRVVEVACDPVDGRYANDRLNDELQQRGPFGVEVSVEVRLTSEYVADEIAAVIAQRPDSIIVMSSHGTGRSAAILGSVTEGVLRRTLGPVVLVGPRAIASDFSGPIIVSVDGSAESEIALPLAAAWASELRTTPWIVSVEDSRRPIAAVVNGDVLEAAYPARLARRLAEYAGRAVEFDELHDPHPGRAVPSFASRSNASMIVASSHGRSGLSRLTLGSVTAQFVRNATCPVTVVRLADPAHAE